MGKTQKVNGKIQKTGTGKSKSKPLWAGRLAEIPEENAFAFQSSINVDKRLVFDDIKGSKAHVTMLGKQGIIPKDSASKIAKELDAIANDIKTGKLVIESGHEDIHSFLEAVLTERLGDTGKMVHAGRSRNDQVAVDFRLYLKSAIPQLQSSLASLVNILLDTAQLHVTSIMPGYTHLQ
ncbi:MAG: argininosuccinate lyase, partial [Treponema sp.]|nr:argininosuccinate lyase [Treponema sp.]